MKSVTPTLSLVATLMLCSPVNHAAPNQFQASPKILGFNVKLSNLPNAPVKCGSSSHHVHATFQIETNMATSYKAQVNELGKTPSWWDSATELENGKYMDSFVEPSAILLGMNKAPGTSHSVTVKWEARAGTDYKSEQKTISYTCEGRQVTPHRPRG